MNAAITQAAHQSTLTFTDCLTILFTLSSSLMTVRGGSRKKQQMPIARLFMDCVVKCKNNLWCALFGELNSSRGSVATSTNLNNATAQSLVASSGVFQLSTEYTS